MLIDEALGGDRYLGRAAHQAPEVDGTTEVVTGGPAAPGDLLRVVVTGSDGVDLIAATAGAEPTGSR